MTLKTFIRDLPFTIARVLAIGITLSACGAAWAVDGVAKVESPVIAAAVAVETSGAKTRFKITLSKPVSAQTSLMERPDRLIIDLPEVSFHLPEETGRKKEGLIASFRYGLFAPGRSRVVMELAQPAVVSAVNVEADAPGGASILVIELSRADRDEFHKAALESAAATAKAAPKPSLVLESKDTRPLIVIDPGHGGIDPGAAASSGVIEKDLVLSFGHKLRRKLEEGGRYRVRMTRDQDVFISLGERVRTARDLRADLFISIHADSISGGQDVRGLTVYTGAERASDLESARLADRENKADAVAGVEARDMPDDVSDILQELTLRETRSFSHYFADRLVGEFDAVARLNKNPRREARFQVLRAPDVPSVLVELGYLSSKQDLDLLMSDEWRNKMANAMAVAVDRFLAARTAKQGPLPGNSRGAAAVLP